jgi:hypothetical protein
MTPGRREQIRRSLACLAESYPATMNLLEQTLALLCEELSLDPLTYFRTQSVLPGGYPGLVVDPETLVVTFDGRTCFLGNILPFRLLARLAQRPNRYFSYEELLADVWSGGRRSATARGLPPPEARRGDRRRAGGLVRPHPPDSGLPVMRFPAVACEKAGAKYREQGDQEGEQMTLLLTDDLSLLCGSLFTI